jgi:AmmeMemoRadiSam system protein B
MVFRRRREIGEQVQNLCPQEIRITGIEQARYPHAGYAYSGRVAASAFAISRR